jgi:UPF0176 protein
MNQELPYWVLAYYLIQLIPDPEQEMRNQKNFFLPRDVRSRLYISHEGINGQMSASQQAAEEYINWMKGRFHGLEVKIHSSHEHVFPKTTVKVRKQLVAMDCEVDLSQRGMHVTPYEWRRMLEEKEDKLLIDMRNDYEWKIGHFEGAELPPCASFREFPNYLRSLNNRFDRKKPVLMYCTGGIRCEFASALLRKEGFEHVFQLKGGVIDYGLEQGADHWKGKLFVFDDRLAVPISGEERAPISSCSHCGCANDVYFNCANMDCNELFLCCLHCLHQHKGCCSSSCIHAERIRQYHTDARPFRKGVYPFHLKSTQED